MRKFTTEDKKALGLWVVVFTLLGIMIVANHYDEKAAVDRYKQSIEVVDPQVTTPSCTIAKQVRVENGVTTGWKDVLVCRNGPTGWVIQQFREVPVCKICHCGKTLCDKECSGERMCAMQCEKACIRRQSVPSSSNGYSLFISGFISGLVGRQLAPMAIPSHASLLLPQE